MFRVACVALSILFAGGAAARGEAPCGIRAMTERVAPVYPPIARAAHVSGTVVLVASFDLDGQVTAVRTVSGPVLLRASAEMFVKGWQADPYTGPRSCPIVVEYALAGGVWCSDAQAEASGIPSSHRKDAQHFVVSGYALATCDPPVYIVRKRKRFGIF